MNVALSSSVIFGYESGIVDKITEYCSHENGVKLEVTYFESDTHHNRSYPPILFSLIQTDEHDVCVHCTTTTAVRWPHFGRDLEGQALRDCEDVRTESRMQRLRCRRCQNRRWLSQ